MKKLYPLLLASLAFHFAFSQSPTWANDVAPILYANCTKCHNSNGIAPFSLMTYSDAYTNGNDIATDVQSHIMPPWPADPSYRHFCDERILSATDIQTITDWVNNGMPSGNLSQAPTPPTYSGIATITNPDGMVQIPTYMVNSLAGDVYRCFAIPLGNASNEFITKVEVLPGNRSIVHHVLVYQDTSATCVNLDNNDPDPGYNSFGGIGSTTASMVAGWAPGQGAYELPPNMGIKILANTNIILQIHYPAGVSGQSDSTQVRFTYSTGIVRQVFLAPVLNYWSTMTNGPLYIPANTVQTFHEQANANLNASIISVAPHMHLLGQSIINYAIDPSNDTIPLISINNWEFHWQGFYNFQQPVHVPQGSTLHAYATYDNTTANDENPNQANPVDVAAGEQTTDEMMIVYYAYVVYQPGDENIVIDSSILAVPPDPNYGNVVKTPQLYDLYPVPAANGILNVSYFLPVQTEATLELVDVNGRIVKTIEQENPLAGFNSAQLSTEGLAKGTYILRLRADGVVRAKTIEVQ